MSDQKPGQEISSEEQLERWVRGESVHRRFEVKLVDDNDNEVGRQPADECTPDFSCCTPSLLAPVEVRQAFAAASGKDRFAFLGNFLSAAMALHAELQGKEPLRVRIATAYDLKLASWAMGLTRPTSGVLCDACRATPQRRGPQ